MKNHAVHFSSETDLWPTPQAFFDELNREFNFTLDPCATEQNAKCSKFFTEKENGLLQSWDNERVFMNPPYGRTIGNWIKKASEARGGGCSLLVACKNGHSIFSRVYIQQIRNQVHQRSAQIRRCYKFSTFSFNGSYFQMI